MKYIKTYENMTDDDLEINEYVICTDTIKYDVAHNHDEYINFLNTNIGQYVGRNKSDLYNYNILYKDVPENILEYFGQGKNDRINIPKGFHIFKASREDITYHSESKEEIEHYISANKYNL